jgi:uncharacterized protein (DUF1810 family)
MTDPYDLERFVTAQSDVYAAVVAELSRGRKTTHWMWFVFPQLAGLGSSAMAQRYALSGLDEARTYLAHPVLGARLRECARLAIESPAARIDVLFGAPDDLKFHACMTLFAHASPDDELFARALQRFFQGRRHDATLRFLRAAGGFASR